MKKYHLEVYLSYIVVLACAVYLRLIPHTPNVSPVASLALFSGAILPGLSGFILPLLAMIISDIFLGFHATIPFVYGSFLLIVGIGYVLRKQTSLLKMGVGSLAGSILFFIITNFGVWMTSSMYEKTFNGLLYCYAMGLPFFRNTLVGDIFYTTVFFVGFNCIRLLFVLMSPSHQKWERRVGNTV